MRLLLRAYARVTVVAHEADREGGTKTTLKEDQTRQPIAYNSIIIAPLFHTFPFGL